MEKKAKIIFITGLIFSLLFCFFMWRYLQSSQNYPINTEHSNNGEDKDSNEPVNFIIEIYNHKIEPSSFTVKPGQDVKLKIVSMEGTHSIAFENENLSWVGGDFGEAGETLEITFTAPREPGSYLFYCARDSHREKGERGEMIVE